MNDFDTLWFCRPGLAPFPLPPATLYMVIKLDKDCDPAQKLQLEQKKNVYLKYVETFKFPNLYLKPF